MDNPSSMRKCNTWRNSLIAGTLGGYGKRIQAHQVAKVESLINNRPRKCLSYKTPLEVASAFVALRP
jgi:IS30 family transposase